MVEDLPKGWMVQEKKLVRQGEQGWVTLISKSNKLRTALLVYVHDLPTAGHLGQTKTLSILRQR